MTLQQIIFFITIYKNKSYTAAAKELGVSQSVLSKQMMALEKEMGSKLIVRNVRHMRLTPHGEVLLPHALQMPRTTVKFFIVPLASVLSRKQSCWVECQF